MTGGTGGSEYNLMKINRIRIIRKLIVVKSMSWNFF